MGGRGGKRRGRRRPADVGQKWPTNAVPSWCLVSTGFPPWFLEILAQRSVCIDSDAPGSGRLSWSGVARKGRGRRRGKEKGHCDHVRLSTAVVSFLCNAPPLLFSISLPLPLWAVDRQRADDELRAGAARRGRRRRHCGNPAGGRKCPFSLRATIPFCSWSLVAEEARGGVCVCMCACVCIDVYCVLWRRERESGEKRRRGHAVATMCVPFLPLSSFPLLFLFSLRVSVLVASESTHDRLLAAVAQCGGKPTALRKALPLLLRV